MTQVKFITRAAYVTKRLRELKAYGAALDKHLYECMPDDMARDERAWRAHEARFKQDRAAERERGDGHS